METVHHVHADDVAQMVMRAIAQLERRGRRGLQHGVAAGGEPARLCRGDVPLVRARAEAAASCRWTEWKARAGRRRTRRRPGSTSTARPSHSIAKARAAARLRAALLLARGGLGVRRRWLIAAGQVRQRRLSAAGGIFRAAPFRCHIPCLGRAGFTRIQGHSMSSIIDLTAPADFRQPRQSDDRGRRGARRRQLRPRRGALRRLDRRP